MTTYARKSFIASSSSSKRASPLSLIRAIRFHEGSFSFAKTQANGAVMADSG